MEIALSGPCWCQETCCPAPEQLCLDMWGAGWAAGQTDAVTSSLHTVEGELETAEGGFGNIFVRDLG